MLGQDCSDFGWVDIFIVFNEGFVIRGGPLCIQLTTVIRRYEVVSVGEGDLFLRFFGHAIIVTAVVSHEPGGRHEGAVNGC